MKPPIKVTPGDMYGSWRVIEEMPRKRWVDKHGQNRVQRMFKCICTECGETIQVMPLSSLRHGLSARCRQCGDKVRSRKSIASNRQIPMLVAATLNVVQHMTDEQLNRLWVGINAEIKQRKNVQPSLSDTFAEGVSAAQTWTKDGDLRPEHFTNPGADEWSELGCNIGDAAWAAFKDGRHFERAMELRDDSMEVLAQCSRSGVITAWRYPNDAPDWDEDHWDAFLDGFDTEANRLAFERGWEVKA